jgi:hypothetical protein
MIDQSVRQLERVREHVEKGERAEAIELLTQLQELWQSEQTVTTTEAARFLGIRSINTLKALLKAEGIQTTMNGSRIMVPIGELLKLKDSRRVRRIRASDAAHAGSFDDDVAMTQPEMEILRDARPGSLPWQRE